MTDTLQDSPEKKEQERPGQDPIALADCGPGPVYTGNPDAGTAGDTADPKAPFEVSFDEPPSPTGGQDSSVAEPSRPESETVSETAEPAKPLTGTPRIPDTDIPDAGSSEPASPGPDARAPRDPGPAEKTFRVLAGFGLLVPLIVLALQTCLGLNARSLWFSDEVRHAAAYQALQRSGEWFMLTLNGQPYPDKPPLYFWFLHVLDKLPTIDPPLLFLLAAALSALLLTAVTWLLARSLGYDKRQSFAASLILLTTFSFLGISHYARMDLLFAVCITLSHLCLYRGWIKTSAPFWLACGFVLAALACLIKGPLGLAFPLVSSIIFLIWRGSFRRAGGRDGALGFGLMLIILLAWISLVLLQEGGRDYLGSMFGRHMIERALDAWHHKQPWWFYLVSLPLAWLPWTLLIFFLPWERLPRLLKGVVGARVQAPGHGWVWISAISGLVLLSALSGKVGIYTLPLYPFMAILTAQGLLSLGALRSRAFFLLLSVLLFILALAFGLAGAYPHVQGMLPSFLRPESWSGMSDSARDALNALTLVKGLPLLAAVCLVFAVILAKATRRSWPGGSLLVLTLFFTTLAQPLALVTAPSLDRLMSPAPQAAILRAYENQGYHVTAFSVTAGTYTYYMGGPMDEVNDWNVLAERLAAYPKIAVVTRMSRWKEWQEKPELHPGSFTVADTQWIAEREYVIVARDALPPAEAGRDAMAAPDAPGAPETVVPEAPADQVPDASGSETAPQVPETRPDTAPETAPPDDGQPPVPDTIPEVTDF